MGRTAVLSVVGILCLAAAAPALGLEWVELKTPCDLFALNPATGAVLAVNAEANTATLYPSGYVDGKATAVVGPVSVVAGAQCVLFKQYKDQECFLLSFKASRQITVLDARTLKTVAKVAAKTVVDDTLTASADGDDPFVYYAGGYNGNGGFISLKTRQWAGDTGVEGSDVAVSADGNYMYARSIDVSPTGFDGFRKIVNPATGGMKWVQIYDDHTSVGKYVPGPYSRYCAAGSSLYSVDLQDKAAELDFTVMCFSRKYPVIVGLSGDQIMAASYNTFKSFGSVALPAGFMGSEGQRQELRRRYYRRMPLACMVDDARKRVLVAYRSRLLVKTFADLRVGDEPFLVCRVESPRQVLVGQTASFTLSPLDRRCKLELGETPAGMKRVGNRLTWTASPHQVGRATIALKLSAGDIKVTQAIELDVVRKHVALPFRPSGVCISPDGQRALVWVGVEQRRWRDEQQDKPSPIALVDLEQGRILLTKTLPYVLRTAAIDANLAYVAPANADRVNALSLEDLTRKNYTLVDSAATELVPIASKRLAVLTAEHGPKVYDTPALKAVDHPIAVRRDDVQAMYRYRYRDSGGPVLPVKVGPNWYGAGCLFGAAFTRPKMLVDVPGMTDLGDRDRREAIAPLPWNRVLDNSALLTRTGQRVCEFGDSPTAVLAAVPVAVSLTTSTKHDNRAFGYRGAARSAGLVLRELVTGKVIQKLPLMSDVPVERERSGEGSRAVVGSQRRIVAVVDDRLFVHDLDAQALAQFPVPFDFQPLDQIAMLGPDKPTVIESKTVGGTAPIEFELLGASKDIEIDTKTGKVTIDGPALAKAARAQFMSAMSEYVRQAFGEAAEQTPRQMVAAAVGQAARRLKAYTGKTPKGYPVLVTVRIAATDKHQHVASLQYQAVLDLPQDQLLGAVEAEIAKLKAEQQEAQKRRAERERQYRLEEQRRRAAYEQQRRAATQSAAEGTQRLEEAVKRLERRLDKLEAQLEVLMELLRAQQRQKP